LLLAVSTHLTRIDVLQGQRAAGVITSCTGSVAAEPSFAVWDKLVETNARGNFTATEAASWRERTLPAGVSGV
jgi:hypothetical protein